MLAIANLWYLLAHLVVENQLARLGNSKLKILLEKFAKSGNPPGTPVRLEGEAKITRLLPDLRKLCLAIL